MKYKEITLHDTSYKFRITTKAQVEIERKIGPLLSQIDRIVEAEVLATILWGSLLTFNHSITLDKTYTLIDKLIDEGIIDTPDKRIEFVMDLLEDAGFLSEEQAETVKNQIK